jgi:hypothetical protein
MANSGDQKFLPTLKKLCEDPDPVIAEHARWAVTTLEPVSTQQPARIAPSLDAPLSKPTVSEKTFGENEHP